MFKQQIQSHGNSLATSRKSDDSIDQIISKVMGKIARRSRRKQETIELNDQMIFSSPLRKEKKILDVNLRLQDQNRQLNASIKNLELKIKKMGKSLNSKNSKQQCQEQIQLKKLRKRLEKALIVNSRIQSQLIQNSKIMKKEIKTRRQQNKKTDRILKTDINSPSKKQYNSPIMEFDQYKLPNSPTIYEKSEHQKKTTSVYQNINKNSPSNNKSSQVCLGMMELIEQETKLDEKVYELEQIIRKNNQEIARFETIIINKLQ